MRVEKLYLTEADNRRGDLYNRYKALAMNAGIKRDEAELYADFKAAAQSGETKLDLATLELIKEFDDKINAGLKSKLRKSQATKAKKKSDNEIKLRKADFESYKQRLIDAGVHQRKADDIAKVACIDFDDATKSADKVSADKYVDKITNLTDEQVTRFNRSDLTIGEVFPDLFERLAAASGIADLQTALVSDKLATDVDSHQEDAKQLSAIAIQLKLLRISLAIGKEIKDKNSIISPKLTENELAAENSKNLALGEKSKDFKTAFNELQLGKKEKFIEVINSKHQNAAKLLNTMKIDTLKNFSKSIGVEALSMWKNNFLRVIDTSYAGQVLITDKLFTNAYNLLYRDNIKLDDTYLQRRNAIIYYPDFYNNVNDSSFANELIKLDLSEEFRNDNQKIKIAITNKDYSTLQIDKVEKPTLRGAVSNLDSDEQKLLADIIENSTPDERKTAAASLRSIKGIPKQVVANHTKK